MNEGQKRWRAEHHDQVLEQQRRWREANRDRVRRKHRESYNTERHRGYQIKHKYGLTPLQYSGMLTQQAGVCAVCRQSMAPVYVDHDHTTGKVRGLLCRNCNLALGHLSDDPARLRRAADYLEDTK